MELKRLYVSTRARRRGIGSALCDAVVSDARRRGVPFVELWTDTRFVEAHALYRKLGWVADGRQRDLHDLSNSTEYYFNLVLAPR